MKDDFWSGFFLGICCLSLAFSIFLLGVRLGYNTGAHERSAEVEKAKQ